MRFRLRTLMVIAAIAPPILALCVWAAQPKDLERRTAAGREATLELRQLLLSATSLEIIDAGNAFPLRAKTFDSSTLQRLADAANIVDVEVYRNVAFTTIENAYLHFRILDGEKVLRVYTFSYPSMLHDLTEPDKPDGSFRIRSVSPKFAKAMLWEMTTVP